MVFQDWEGHRTESNVSLLLTVLLKVRRCYKEVLKYCLSLKPEFNSQTSMDDPPKLRVDSLEILLTIMTGKKRFCVNRKLFWNSKEKKREKKRRKN